MIAGGVGLRPGFGSFPIPGPVAWALPTQHQREMLLAVFNTEPNLLNQAWRQACRAAMPKPPTDAQLQSQIDRLMPKRQTYGLGSIGIGTSEKVLRLSEALCPKCGARMLIRKGKERHPAVGCRQDGEFLPPALGCFTGPKPEWVDGAQPKRLLP